MHHLCSGQQQVARGTKLARARSQIILLAAGSEINLSWQKQLLTIRVWAVWFFKSRSVMVFTRSTNITSSLQFMPTTRNITAYLYRINVLNIIS